MNDDVITSRPVTLPPRSFQVAAVKAFDLALNSGGPSECLNHAINLCMKAEAHAGEGSAASAAAVVGAGAGAGVGSNGTGDGKGSKKPVLQLDAPDVPPAFQTTVPIPTLPPTDGAARGGSIAEEGGGEGEGWGGDAVAGTLLDGAVVVGDGTVADPTAAIPPDAAEFRKRYFEGRVPCVVASVKSNTLVHNQRVLERTLAGDPPPPPPPPPPRGRPPPPHPPPPPPLPYQGGQRTPSTVRSIRWPACCSVFLLTVALLMTSSHPRRLVSSTGGERVRGGQTWTASLQHTATAGSR